MKNKIIKIIIAFVLIIATTMSLGACGGGKKSMVVSIEVTGAKTEYQDGDFFDKTGMVVTALYDNGKTKAVENYTISLTRALKKTDKKIRIEYTEGELTVKASISINVGGDWKLMVTGATVDGKSELGIPFEGKLPAEATVVIENDSTFLGWQDESCNFYTNYAELVAAFVMPEADTFIKALQPSDFNQAFTPSCSFKHIDGKNQTNAGMTHVKVGEVTATKYEFATKQDIVILNGSDAVHDGEEGIDNYCPCSSTAKKIMYMTFLNNTDAEIKIAYEVEAHGVIGTVEVTLPANGKKSAFLITEIGKNSYDSPFHQLRILEGGTNGYSISIYGMRAI